VFRTDNVLEYVKKDVSIFCSKNKIIHQTSYSHTSQQNGVVERKHKHILDVARTMMIRGGTRNKFWGGLQFFITYAYELYEFIKRIKQYFPLNQG